LADQIANLTKNIARQTPTSLKNETYLMCMVQ